MMKSRSFMQKSFSKSFSVDLAKQWCMDWFYALKNERTRRTTFYYTHTTHFFFFTYNNNIIQQGLKQGRSFEIRSRENFSSKLKKIYRVWKIN